MIAYIMPDPEPLPDDSHTPRLGLFTMDGKPSDGQDTSGHRSRLRKRLLEGGVEALADHEVIELLLIQAVPRRDMKPLARSLLKRFGSLSGVLQADMRTLSNHPGMGEATVAGLRIVTIAATRMIRQKVRNVPIISSWQSLIEYLTLDMAHLTVERVRVLYLNNRNMLLLDEVLSEGSINEAAIYPREVIHRALDLGATALILVHNHPSGASDPSREDIEITKQISEAGRLLDINLYDHVIIGSEGYTSLRSKGLI